MLSVMLQLLCFMSKFANLRRAAETNLRKRPQKQKHYATETKKPVRRNKLNLTKAPTETETLHHRNKNARLAETNTSGRRNKKAHPQKHPQKLTAETNSDPISI